VLDFKDFAATNELAFKPVAQFGPDEVEERQKLLFDLCKLLWPAPSSPVA
jgi:hypothetical protein